MSRIKTLQAQLHAAIQAGNTTTAHHLQTLLTEEIEDL